MSSLAVVLTHGIFEGSRYTIVMISSVPLHAQDFGQISKLAMKQLGAQGLIGKALVVVPNLGVQRESSV
jgi:hypothetical protein